MRIRDTRVFELNSFPCSLKPMSGLLRQARLILPCCEDSSTCVVPFSLSPKWIEMCRKMGIPTDGLGFGEQQQNMKPHDFEASNLHYIYIYI